MSLLSLLKRNRERLDCELGEAGLRALSALSASRAAETERMIAAHATGRVLDVGCGRMPFRACVLRHAATYEGLDCERRTEGVTYLTDVVAMDGVPRDSFDTVLCLEVLEHLPSPQRALRAIREVMSPGAKLVVTVPHLSRLHEQPHDYWRFTEHGLRVLAEDAGLDVVELRPHAGLASFIAHQASTLLLGLAWPVPVVRQAALALNRALLVPGPRWLDRAVDWYHLAPAGYVLVASRPERGKRAAPSTPRRTSSVAGRCCARFAGVRPARVLEIGCGRELLGRLAGRGWEGIGLEISAEAAQVARRALERHGARMRVVEDPREVAGVFPLVIASEVLEHVEDDAGALAQWRRWVEPGGRLVLTVPAHAGYWTDADVFVGHHRRYERDGLRRLVEAAGFAIDAHWSIGFPVTAVTTRLRRIAYRHRLLRAAGMDRDARARLVVRLDACGRRGALAACAIEAAGLALHALQIPFLRTDLGATYLVSCRRTSEEVGSR